MKAQSSKMNRAMKELFERNDLDLHSLKMIKRDSLKTNLWVNSHGNISISLERKETQNLRRKHMIVLWYHFINL